MQGENKGVQNEQPKSAIFTVYVHCSNHSLILHEVAKENNGICDILSIVKDYSNTILKFSK